MCGLTGSLSLSQAPISQTSHTLWAMIRLISHRGTYGEGRYISPDQRLGLAHRLLAIFDRTPAGAQPMHGPDGNGLTIKHYWNLSHKDNPNPNPKCRAYNLIDYVQDLFGSQIARERPYRNADNVLSSFAQAGQFSRKTSGHLSLKLWHQEFHDKASGYKNMLADVPPPTYH